MDDAGAALLELEAVKGLASYTANVSGNRDGGKKNSAGAGVCSWELRDPASFSLLAVSAKKSKGIHLKGFHMMQLHLS